MSICHSLHTSTSEDDSSKEDGGEEGRERDEVRSSRLPTEEGAFPKYLSTTMHMHTPTQRSIDATNQMSFAFTMNTTIICEDRVSKQVNLLQLQNDLTNQRK